VIVRATFSLDEAAWDFPRGVGLFPVLDEEGEEAERGFPVAHGHSGQDHGVTEGDNGASGSLLRHAPGLDDEAPSGEDFLDALHSVFYSLFRCERTQCAPGALARGTLPGNEKTRGPRKMPARIRCPMRVNGGGQDR